MSFCRFYSVHSFCNTEFRSYIVRLQNLKEALNFISDGFSVGRLIATVGFINLHVLCQTAN